MNSPTTIKKPTIPLFFFFILLTPKTPISSLLSLLLFLLFLKTLISHMDINQTHVWKTIINHQPPPQIDQSHHQTSTNFPSSFPHLQSHHFPPPNFLSNQTETQLESTQDPKQQKQLQEHEDDDEEEEKTEEEELGAMKEMMYRMASMQPVEIDPASVRKPRRRNVRISDDPQSVAARHRRERITERIRILQRLVPGGTKLDTASMLEEAVRYVKFLKRQIRLLETTSANNSGGTTSDKHHPCNITTRSTGSAADGSGGFLGFGICAAAADGVHVDGGGGADRHGVVCFGGHEVISDP